MKTRKLITAVAIASALSFLTGACSKTASDATLAWKTIETPILNVDVPNDWSFIDLHSIDTYNGLLTNTRDSLKFDYGINLDTFAIDTSKFIFRYTTVD